LLLRCDHEDLVECDGSVPAEELRAGTLFVNHQTFLVRVLLSYGASIPYVIIWSVNRPY
jgi:hypothetical protein